MKSHFLYLENLNPVPLIFSDYEHTFGLTTRNTRTWIKILRTLRECVKRRQINAKSTVPSNNNNNVELGPQSLHFCTTLPHVRLIISRHMAFGTLYGPANYNNYRRCTILLFCFYFYFFLRIIIRLKILTFFKKFYVLFFFLLSGVAYIYWFHYDDGGKKKWESFFLVTSTNGSFFNSSSLFLFISFVYFLSLFFFYLISLFVCLFSLSLCLYDRTKLSGVLVLVRDLRQRC